MRYQPPYLFHFTSNTVYCAISSLLLSAKFLTKKLRIVLRHREAVLNMLVHFQGVSQQALIN